MLNIVERRYTIQLMTAAGNIIFMQLIGTVNGMNVDI